MATKRMKRSKKHKQKMRRRKYYRQGPYDEPTGAPGEPETTYSPEESGNWRQRQKKRVKEFATKQYEDVAPYGTKTGAFVKENVGGMAREAARPVKEVKGAVAGTISTGRQVYGILTNPVKSTVGTFLSKEQQKNQAYIEQKQRIADKKAKSYKERQEEKADKKLKNLKTYGGTGAGNWFRRNVTTRGSTKKQSLSDIRKETGRIKQIAEGEGIHIRNTKFRDKFLLRKTKELGTEEYNKLSEDEKKAYKKMQNRRASWDNLKDTVVKKQLTPKGLAFRGVRGAGNLTSSGIKRGGEALSMVGGSAFAAAKQSISPLQIFALGWQEMGNKMKFLVGLVFALVILFVPIGVFFYAGWAVAVGFMFLISLIYWIFVNIFNGVAYVIISLINGVVTIILQVVIVIVETILNFLIADGTILVPNPKWAATYRGDAWTSTEYHNALTAITNGLPVSQSSYAIQVPNEYWYPGHLLMESSLIRYDQIATIPGLMLVSTPPWDPAWNETIVSWILRSFGITDIANTFRDTILGLGFATAMKTFVETSPPYLVILAGLLPIIALISVIAYWFYRTKKKVDSFS